jgi:formate dehydrogenase assembly factor FdhD
MSTVMIVLYKDLGKRVKDRRNIVKKTACIHVAQLIEAQDRVFSLCKNDSRVVYISKSA